MRAREAPGTRGPADASAIGFGELGLVAALGLVLALLVTWPLVLHLGGRVPSDSHDVLLQAWQIAWDGHALVHQPLHFFQANTFWPLRDSLAFSDAQAGYSLAGLIGSGPTAAAARFDLLYIASWAFVFAAAYLLARELGASRFGALVGGLAFAYAPWRLGHEAHLHVLSAGGVALALFLLLRGYRRASARQIVAGWAVAAWQVSLGFTLGLQLLYLLLVVGVMAAIGWLRHGRPRPARRVALSTIGGVAVVAAVSVTIAVPYVRVLHDHPEARRTLAAVSLYSPPLRSFAAAAPDNLIWGGITSSVRNGLPKIAGDENVLFPGVAILILALAGLRSRAYPVVTRRRLAAVAAISLVFALGLTVAGDWSPYRFLWELAPGWQGIRTPSRIFTLTSLALALLAAAGADRALARARGGVGRRAVALAIPIAVAVEGFGPATTMRVPAPPPALKAARAPLLILPTNTSVDNIYEYWSTDGFPAMLNGRSGFTPRQQQRIRPVLRGFPDRRSLALLSAMGVHTVLLDRARAPGTSWRGAAAKSVRGLAVARREVGDMTVFALPEARP